MLAQFVLERVLLSLLLLAFLPGLTDCGVQARALSAQSLLVGLAVSDGLFQSLSLALEQIQLHAQVLHCPAFG